MCKIILGQRQSQIVSEINLIYDPMNWETLISFDSRLKKIFIQNNMWFKNTKGDPNKKNKIKKDLHMIYKGFASM